MSTHAGNLRRLHSAVAAAAADYIEELEAELAVERDLADRAAVILESLDREPTVWLADYAARRSSPTPPPASHPEESK